MNLGRYVLVAWILAMAPAGFITAQAEEAWLKPTSEGWSVKPLLKNANLTA